MKLSACLAFRHETCPALSLRSHFLQSQYNENSVGAKPAHLEAR